MTQLPFEDLPEKPANPATGFIEFYDIYPRHVGRKGALAKYLKALTRATHTEIMAGLTRYKANKPAYCDWMHPTTFLNGDHWEDEYDSPVKRAPDPTHQQTIDSAVWTIQHGTSNGHMFPVDRSIARECVAKGLVTEEQARAWL